MVILLLTCEAPHSSQSHLHSRNVAPKGALTWWSQPHHPQGLRPPHPSQPGEHWKTRPIHDVPQPQPAVGAISKSFDPQQVISVTSKPSNPCVRRASLDRVWPCFSGRSVGGSAAGTHASASNHVRPFSTKQDPRSPNGPPSLFVRTSAKFRFEDKALDTAFQNWIQ